ncbi:MAG: four helix bundle protein [Verrucomicrobia bacterium]|nr:four helix bundle protein [Verrucomicrobiota bacterium]MBV8279169.1 four helix bundle protein [Verrucomicrobiota bacterium]
MSTGTPSSPADRTKRFAVRLFDLIDDIPQIPKGLVVQTQLAKAASSVAANYRAAQRSRSRAEFISKLSVTFRAKLTAVSALMALGAMTALWRCHASKHHYIFMHGAQFRSSR